jgi:predicted RNA-binding protein with PIN domain
MLYLIDGYNLLYAMGVLLPKRTGPLVLEYARRRLLSLLGERHGAEAGAVTVVFDARKAPPGAPAEMDYEGIHVAFAVDQEEADDLIEQLIRRARAPRQLTVVSDDHRIQHAARRRQCVVLGCGEYMDWLARKRQPSREEPRQTQPHPSRPPEGRLSPDEVRLWLETFGDLEKDPDWKELFDLPGGLGDDVET